jgi:hypothetical protein
MQCAQRRSILSYQANDFHVPVQLSWLEEWLERNILLPSLPHVQDGLLLFSVAV